MNIKNLREVCHGGSDAKKVDARTREFETQDFWAADNHKLSKRRPVQTCELMLTRPSQTESAARLSSGSRGDADKRGLPRRVDIG